MAGLHIDHARGRAAFLDQLDRFLEAAHGASDLALLGASRCHGWSALEVLVHVRVGLQEMVGGALNSTDDAPDQDAATYWREYEGGGDEVGAILWTRRTASAYHHPREALEHLDMAAHAVDRAVRAVPEGAVAFQHHVLGTGDFLATWAVELTVHHLDLAEAAGTVSPTPAALRLGRATVDALAGSPSPTRWADDRAVLAGFGRITAAE
ncbi:maleylpyruvate isomerase N-terminal domain-containing protein [Pseudonocardia pini]|uniref:maleylpyruvate isomerase N-terminal domain-containing protein n=1 Tax=Pseudonocardia pini TaxID=2758030 RepID=UPI0015F04901|nr:maleylpyruvate isomerase N-terminal domain-containing protein [Pseudonocardia pini]